MLHRLREELARVAFPVVYVTARITDLFSPKGHLMDWTGEPYMLRFNIIPEGSRASRVLKFLTGFESVRLHHIRQRDDDRDLHNHPFQYSTLILKGGYLERYLDTFNSQDLFYGPVSSEKVRLTVPGQVYHGDSWMYHRIAEVLAGGSWSLFFMKSNTHNWGFLVDGVYVDRKVYFHSRDWPGE